MNLEEIRSRLNTIIRTELTKAGMRADSSLMNFSTTISVRGTLIEISVTFPKHFIYVDDGTRPHRIEYGAKMPPVSAIMEWISLKTNLPRTMGTAFAVAKSIQKRGLNHPGIPAKRIWNSIEKTFNDTLLDRLVEAVVKKLEEPVNEDLKGLFDGTKNFE